MNRSVLKKGVSLVAFAAAIQCVAVPQGYQQFGYVKDDTPVVTNAELAMEAAIERIRLEAEEAEGRVDEKITNTKEELAQRIVASTNDLPVMIESATNALKACVRDEIDEALRSAKDHADIAAENARAESKAYADDAASSVAEEMAATVSNVMEKAVAMTNAIAGMKLDKSEAESTFRKKDDFNVYGEVPRWTWFCRDNTNLAQELNNNGVVPEWRNDIAGGAWVAVCEGIRGGYVNFAPDTGHGQESKVVVLAFGHMGEFEYEDVVDVTASYGLVCDTLATRSDLRTKRENDDSVCHKSEGFSKWIAEGLNVPNDLEDQPVYDSSGWWTWNTTGGTSYVSESEDPNGVFASFGNGLFTASRKRLCTKGEVFVTSDNVPSFLDMDKKADKTNIYSKSAVDAKFRGVGDFYTYPILEMGNFEWTCPDHDFEAEMKARNAFPRLDYTEGKYQEYFFDMEYRGRWFNGYASCSTNDLETQFYAWHYEPIYDDDGNWIDDSYEEYLIEGRRKAVRVNLEHPNGRIVCADSFPGGRIAKFTYDGKIVAAAASSNDSGGDYRSPSDNISHGTYGYGEWVSDNYTGRSSLVWDDQVGTWRYTCAERNFLNYDTYIRSKYAYSVGIFGDYMKRPHSSTSGQPFVTLDCVLDLHQKATNAAATVVAGHVAKRNNPHGVTAAQVGAYTKEEVESRMPKDVVQFVKDNEGGMTAVSVGSGNSRFGKGSLANGSGVDASGLYAHAEGNASKAQASYSRAGGLLCVASANYSHAEGTHTEALANGSHTDGNRARANSVYAYVWQGHNNIMTDPSWYVSHGAGTFNVNPVGGLDGFYIGEQNLTTILANAGRMTSASAKTGVVEPVVKRMLKEALSKLDAETATAKDVIQALLEMCEED